MFYCEEVENKLCRSYNKEKYNTERTSEFMKKWSRSFVSGILAVTLLVAMIPTDMVTAAGVIIPGEEYPTDDGLLKYVLQEEDNTVWITGYNTIGNTLVTDAIIPAEIDGHPVTGIADGAFASCHSLTSIVIPDSVTDIGAEAFRECRSLKSVTISNSVTVIGVSAFADCEALTEIVIPDSVKEIKDNLFIRCTKLASVRIPDTVTGIGSSAFEDCASLTSIILPGSVKTIGERAFNASGLTGIVIPNGVEKIDGSTFAYCTDLKNVTLPGSVKTIGGYAFAGCKSLEKIALPGGVTEIGNSAFWECENLESLSIPEGVTGIGDAAFSKCFSLKNVIIPQSVTNIGNSAFSDCESLTEVAIPKGVTRIEHSVFSSCGNLKKVTLPEGITTIGMGAFTECPSLTDINIPKGVKAIERYAFYACGSLPEMILPEGVEAIEEATFAGCANLKNVVLSKGLQTIKETAFGGCRQLTQIVIPEGTVSIGANAFESCDAVTRVIIPKSIKTIGDFAINSSSLKYIHYRGSETEWNRIQWGEKGGFFDTATICYNSDGGKDPVECNHALTKTVNAKARTCTEDGYSGDIYCANSDCGKLLSKGYRLPAEGHKVVVDKDKTVAATCKKNGSLTKKCTKCGRTTKETIYYIKTIKLSKTSLIYNGKSRNPSVTVKDSQGNKISSKYYSVSYKNHKNVGVATVTIQFRKNYKGTVTKTFKIIPKATSVSKVSAKRKAFSVKWKKQSSQTTGYMIQYSTSSKFKGAKTVTIDKNKTTSKTISKLKAGKKYYVRICTYKKVKVKGKYTKICSDWSKVKSIKTKR